MKLIVPIGGQRGSTAVGLVVGLILGLLVAVIVAIFVTKAPVPWVNKVPATKPSEIRTAGGTSGADLPDPNRSLNSKAGKADTNPNAPAEQRDSILGLLGQLGQENTPKASEIKSGDAAKSAPVNATPSTPPPANSESKSDTENTRYMLQAGAFRDRSEAEERKGKLAFLGYESRITTVEREGNTIYRVRIGPFKDEEAKIARKRLADGGIETSLIPMR